MVLCAIASLALVSPAKVEARGDLFGDALGHWRLGIADGGKPAAVAVGSVELGAPAGGSGATEGATVARLTNAYFDAGRGLGVRGSAVTVYLRARDPRGIWSYALLAKRGDHSVVNYNLFSIDLDGNGIGDIGFELRTERGFVMVSFPISEVEPAAWHDFVGRYDGKTIELICDGRVMANRRWPGGDLAQNDEPTLIGAETDRGRIVRPFTGEMEEAAVWPRALSDEEVALLCRTDELVPGRELPMPYRSPVHYRPDPGALADTIPFYWNGEYHVFYLLANLGGTPWAHIRSRDLINWEELPIALPLGRPEEPDGGCVFTGSAIEADGLFHIFYTGFNPEHPVAREQIMHATSPDLITWTKHPHHTFMADGIRYENRHGEDFRDPFVFWNEEEGRWWMLLCARDAATGGFVTGVAASADLVHWQQISPLFGGTLGPHECPDLFRIGERWYLIYSPSAGTTDYAYAEDLRGPWIHPIARSLDTTTLYAAKRMFDGRRHILVGWIRDLEGERDTGGGRWGGDMCVPREVYEVRPGVLGSRPVPEATAVFTREVLELGPNPVPEAIAGEWTYGDGVLFAAPTAGTATCRFEVPDNYMLRCRLEPQAGGLVRIGFREGEAPLSGYYLVVNPPRREAEIGGSGFRYARRCDLPEGAPIEVTAFVQGTIIECFVNDAHAFSCRAYDHPRGRLSIGFEGGPGRITMLSVRVPAE